MSYILDALKKSENERQNQDLPDLNAIHQRPELQVEKRRSIWPVAIPIVLLLNIGGFWFLWERSASEGDGSNTPGARMPENSTSIASEPPGSSNQQINTPAATQTLSVQNPVSEQVVAIPRNDIQNEQTELLITPSDAYRNTGNNPGVAPQQDQTSTARNDQTVSKITALPTNIQRQIPDLRFSSHLYADDRSFRMVNINGNVFHEGDIIAEGIRLERISEEGVVLNYLHYTFEISVIRDWSFR